MRQVLLLGLLAVCGCVTVPEPVTEEKAADPYFANTPLLKLDATPPIAVVSHVKPTLFGPSSGKVGHSYYVFGIGQIHEVRMDNGRLRRHAVPFDRQSRRIYGAGANGAWLGHDQRIYFGLQGKPARLGRFDPRTSKAELIGTLRGHTVLRHLWGPENKLYLVTYPAMLTEVDVAAGQVRHLGRLAPDALYVWGKMWVGTDGWFYCTPGQRPQRKAGVNLATGETKLFDELPTTEATPPIVIDFPDCRRFYHVQLTAQGAEATLAFAPMPADAVKGKRIRLPKAPPLELPGGRSVSFTCSTVARDVHTIAAGPDGKIYGCGSYNNFAFDPATGKAARLAFRYNIYEYLTVEDRLYFGGYPNARVGRLDTLLPINAADRPIHRLTKPDDNPREILQIHRLADFSDPEHKPLKMKRTWTLVRGADGLLWTGSSATRQNRGGALVAIDPKTDKPVWSLRDPYFTYAGIAAIGAIDNGKMLAIVTWTSPDPQAPGKEPSAGQLFLFDVAKRQIVFQTMPMPDIKVLRAILWQPGTRMLVGLGLRGVVPTSESDDSFYGNGELFFFDLDRRETVKRQPFDFHLSRREGSPIILGPDGALWLSGGGGLLRVDARRQTIEPVARIGGASGDFAFIGSNIYALSGPVLRWGDISAHLTAPEG